MYLIYFFYLLNHFWKQNNSVAWIQQKIIDNVFLFFIYLTSFNSIRNSDINTCKNQDL